MKVKRRRIKRGRVEIIPMIDTIVILLIFYMSFSRFAEMEREANIALPQSVAGDEFKKLPNQVIINMFSAEDVSVGGQSYKLDEIPALLGHIKIADPSISSVILRGNRDLTYRELSDFMKVCANSGFADVTFATLER